MPVVRSPLVWEPWKCEIAAYTEASTLFSVPNLNTSYIRIITKYKNVFFREKIISYQ